MIRFYNKKAFTLVELLAVIVILGLLVVLTVPAVSSYINQTRKDSYVLHEADMKVATSNMMSDCIKNNVEGCVPKSGESRTVTLDYLIENKYSEVIKDPENTDISCNEENSYVVVTNNGTTTADLDYKVCLVCSEYKSSVCDEVVETPECDADSDSSAPTCGDIVGESTIWTNKDRVISVECSDEGCGCEKNTFYHTYTENIKTDEFIITDRAGNETKCDVNVYVDKGKPTCSLKISSYDVSGNDGWYGGSAPKVEFATMSDDLSNIATFGLGTSRTNYDFNKNNTYEVSPGISMIYGYVKDGAGNIGTCSIEVKYDPVKPTGNITYGYQVYPKSDISTKSNDTISLNNIISEYGNITGIKVYLSSRDNGIHTAVKSESNTLVSRTISKDVNEMYYTIPKNTYDNLSISFSSSTNLKYITKIEVITDHLLDADSIFYTNEDIRVYVNSKDSISGSKYYSFDNGSWQDDNYYDYSSNREFNVKIKDVSGNVSSVISGNINNIDKLSPTCTLTRDINPFIAAQDWYKETVTVSFSTYEDSPSTTTSAMSGVRDYSFNADGLGTNKTSTQNTATNGIDHTGYVVDKAGNIGNCSTNIKLDLTNPTAGTITMKKNNSSGSSISNNAKVNTNVYISLNIGSDTGSVASGHYTTKYTVKRGSTTVTTDATGANTYNVEGNYTVTVTTTDNSGRTSTNTYNFLIDKTKPTCGTVTGESTSWINTERTISVGCNDTGSLCSKPSFSDTWKTTSTKTSSIVISDNAGNTESCPVNVYLDVDNPTCSVSGGSSDWTRDNVVVNGTCYDTGGSGCVGNVSETYSSNTNTSSASPGTVYDNAGNSTVCGGVTVKVDKCTAKSATCTDTGSWSSCSNKCGDGTKSIATSCQDYSTYGSGFACGDSYASTRSETCTGTDCDVEVPFTSCPSCEDLFGSAQSTVGGADGSYAFAYPAYGKLVTVSSYKCYASGGTLTDSYGNKYCNRTVGYDRICYTDACGGWKGKTADYMLDNGAFGSCTKCSRYWCECSRWD